MTDLTMRTFAAYWEEAAWQSITLLPTEYYPEYLEESTALYQAVIDRFAELLTVCSDSGELLTRITKEPNTPPQNLRTQLMRVFRMYAGRNIPVEMLKKKTLIPNVIKHFGKNFRPLEQVKEAIICRPFPDETLSAIFSEYQTRGEKGYELTDRFFSWFDANLGKDYSIEGPRRAGRDIILSSALPDFPSPIPADFLIYRNSDRRPLVVGFARYDSDRGGAQEDDRTGGNRDKVTVIRSYARARPFPLKLLFVNDGPGLLLGTMWRDYASLEEYGEGDVMVCTLQMLAERFRATWFNP